MRWIETLEKYFDNIAPELQSEVRAFLKEYNEKKDTHSASSLEGLSKEDLEKILYLELSDNKTEVHLNQVANCKNLKILDLNAPITGLGFLSDLPDLRILALESGNISHGSKYLVGLKKLIALYVSNNEGSINFSDDLSKIKKLLICDFYGETEDHFQNFTTFPSNLIHLGLVGQNIKIFPDLSKFSNLVYLDLYSNAVEFIPSSISNLKKLKELYLSFNKIKSLPFALFSLAKLETFYFSNNKIDEFPIKLLSLPNLKEIRFSGNPYSDSLNIGLISDILEETQIENEFPYLGLIQQFSQNTLFQSDYNYVTLKIPKSLQTPMLQYFEFFKDYVETTKGKDIIFDIKREKEGLVLVTNGDTAITLPQISNYFEEYVSLTQQKSEDWVFNFETPATAMQADILRLKMENEVGRLKNAFQIAKLESQHLSNQLSDKQAENQFLKELSQSLSNKIDILIGGETVEPLHVDQLLLDIQNVAVKMLERKYSQQLENLHNDVLTDFLRQKGYQVTDQTRSGRSKLGVGEIDLMIRKKDGTPFSIIETFRLKSCGKDNKTVAEHLDKLLHNYDTAGHERNFVIVYAEAVGFERLWNNYKNYISEINGKPAFRAEYPLIKFEEKSEISDKSSIKIGLATHRREGTVVEVYHVFINMFA